MTSAGEQLIERGWRQGSVAKGLLLPLPFLIHHSDGGWTVDHEDPNPDTWTVVVSQSCDIERDESREPFVELMHATWTTDEAIVRMAKGNSFRYFLLRRREDGPCLVADAPRRALVEKAALLHLTPEFRLEDEHEARFRTWLAGRYGRVALEKEIVQGIQRTLVNAIGKTARDEAVRSVLDGIREIRMIAPAADEASLLFIREGTLHVSMSQVAELAGAVVEAIQKQGMVTAVTWDLVDLSEISAEDYLASVQLPLDHYTLPGEASEAVTSNGEELSADRH